MDKATNIKKEEKEKKVEGSEEKKEEKSKSMQVNVDELFSTHPSFVSTQNSYYLKNELACLTKIRNGGSGS
jgi:hypothetical protein